MMKYEWRKKDKKLYIPKREPELIVVPPMHYLVVNGEGNPNGDVFSACVEALYALSYGVKMMAKTGQAPEGYYDYTVFPLEAVWNLSEKGIEAMKNGASIIELKDDFIFTAMIRQPDYLDSGLYEAIREKVMAKKKKPLIEKVEFRQLDEGKSLQMLHIGSYDDEPGSFERMEVFAKDQGLSRKGHDHKEIYLSDPRRVTVDKLKTTLRFWLD